MQWQAAIEVFLLRKAGERARKNPRASRVLLPRCVLWMAGVGVEDIPQRVCASAVHVVDHPMSHGATARVAWCVLLQCAPGMC